MAKWESTKNSIDEFKKKHPEDVDGFGYFPETVEVIMGDKAPEFRKWMSGQTMMLDSESGNTVIYTYDVWRFLCSPAHRDWWD